MAGQLHKSCAMVEFWSAIGTGLMRISGELRKGAAVARGTGFSATGHKLAADGGARRPSFAQPVHRIRTVEIFALQRIRSELLPSSLKRLDRQVLTVRRGYKKNEARALAL
jgi:hypothetical protein